MLSPRYKRPGLYDRIREGPTALQFENNNEKRERARGKKKRGRRIEKGREDKLSSRDAIKAKHDVSRPARQIVTSAKYCTRGKRLTLPANGFT